MGNDRNDSTAAQRMRRYRARQRGEDVPIRKPGPGRIPEDLLALPAECEAILNYLVSLMAGVHDEERLAIEREQIARAARDRKIKMLMRHFRDSRPDIAGAEPYVGLPAKLRQLFQYRDVIAHSYPDHGDRYRRLRRVGGRNEVVAVTQQKITEEWQRGIECHSALRFMMVYLSDLPTEATQP
jgi:hypothetical protein